MSAPSRPVSLMYRLRRYFFTGLVVLFPLVVTVFALIKLFKFADGLLGNYINSYLGAHYNVMIPGLGLLLTVLLIFSAGALHSHFLGGWLVQQIEVGLGRLPLVKHIYPSVKQLTRFVLADGEDEASAPFRRVVLVEYPRPGVYSIAFVTNEQPTPIAGSSATLLTVLIPTPPSPLTGPIIFVPKQDATPLDISVEDAFKLVVSDGVVAGPLKALKKS